MHVCLCTSVSRVSSGCLKVIRAVIRSHCSKLPGRAHTGVFIQGYLSLTDFRTNYNNIEVGEVFFNFYFYLYSSKEKGLFYIFALVNKSHGNSHTLTSSCTVGLEQEDR